LNSVCPRYKAAIIQGMLAYGKSIVAVAEVLRGEGNDEKIKEIVDYISTCDGGNCFNYDHKRDICKGG